MLDTLANLDELLLDEGKVNFIKGATNLEIMISHAMWLDDEALIGRMKEFGYHHARTQVGGGTGQQISMTCEFARVSDPTWQSPSANKKAVAPVYEEQRPLRSQRQVLL